MVRFQWHALAVLLVMGLGGCGADAASSGAGAVRVVATTTQLADLARSVAGDRARVTGILTPNADPHEYEVRPSDLDALSGARLVLQSGGDLDAWLDKAVRSAGGSPAIVKVSDSVRTIKDGGGHGIDPHWWQDPRNAMRAVRRIRDALARVDPRNAPAYRARARASLAELARLDSAVAACIDRIPPDGRKLVTTHDALGYYARRYGLEIIGAVIPSLSTRAQASAGQTAELIDVIRREKVKAVFAESSVNPKVEKAISRESGAAIGRPLYADALGSKGSGGDTYVKSIQANTRAIVAGLTRGSVTCSFPGVAGG